ncbi:MAG: PSD1 and planctomycete cytochrome C domain-containing protein, partial [Pirellulaceae bacterium]|nr:PSD1 and planctomycete cytochrome C domain-containing protein [Pirellulaceae bacterium]
MNLPTNHTPPPILTARLLSLILAWLGTAISLQAAPPTPSVSAVQHFEKQIRPVLASKCIKCHGPLKQKAKLRLDSRAGMLKGGESGPAIVPGKPADSLLITALLYEELEMPPAGKLNARVITDFKAWIAANAPWPEQTANLRDTSHGITERDRQWWAFQPLQRPVVPQLDQRDRWLHNAVDHFVLQKMQQHRLTPAPAADKTTLLRRLYFDLVGVPPMPAEVTAYLENPSPDAWEQTVDKLLVDPRYGEHWSRFWLDLVRYSDSDGWNQDALRTNIWKYRDYVINAFNNDKPYADFVREQLAGDEVPGDHPEYRISAGFLRLGIYEYNQRDARGQWNDIMNEMTDVAGDVFLGISMACARCHDHKFDPILQTDYFALRSFFEPIIWQDDVLEATQSQQEAHRLAMTDWNTRTASVREKLDAFLEPHHTAKWESTVAKFPREIRDSFHQDPTKRTSWDEQMTYLVSRQFYEEGGGPLKSLGKEDKALHAALLKELAAHDKIKPPPLGKLMTVSDHRGRISPTTIPGDSDATAIAPAYLTVLHAPGDTPLRLPSLDRSSGRRTALANWIGRNDNPLTNRVIVNRLWQQHFGKGLVTTANDFGASGQRPTHPELLDWLTTEFIARGGRFKPLHKLILMSATWQQSALHPAAKQQQQRDPAEHFLWRAPVRRLTAEQIRDTLLSVTGELSSQVGGPSVDAKTPRRGLYVKHFRNRPDPFLHAFDVSGGLKSVSQRSQTTTPTQSLLMINGDYALARAGVLAKQLSTRKMLPAEILSEAFVLTWGRPPSAQELSKAVTFSGGPFTSESDRITEENLVDF